MLTNLQNKIKALESFSFQDELVKIVTDNKEKLADLQAAQLAKGINSKGEKIYPYYSEYTIEQKREHGVGLGKIVSHVTYFDTGELYRKLRAQIQGTKFSMKADTFKFDKMVKRSGKDVVGLNVDSRRDFVNEITRPNILAVYKKKVTDV